LDAMIDPVAIVVIALAMTIGAVAKGVTGLGLPILAVPVMATFLGVEQAVVVMAVPTFLTNAWLIRAHREHAREARHLPVMLTLGFVGTVFGTVFLTAVDPSVPAIVLAVLVLAYIAFRLFQPTFAFREHTTAWSAPVVGLLGGVLHGATGVSGPVIATYLHGFRLRHEAFVLAVATIFQTFALVQIGTFIVLGRYDLGNVVLTLAALVPVLVMLPVGIRLGRRLEPRRVEQMLFVVLFASATRLLWNGVTGLL